MVGDNADRNIVVCIVAVRFARYLAYLVNNFADRVDLKHIVNALHNASKTLKSHTRVYVLLRKLLIRAVAHIVELGENVVPDLHISVALAAGLTVGASAAVLFASVKVYL